MSHSPSALGGLRTKHRGLVQGSRSEIPRPLSRQPLHHVDQGCLCRMMQDEAVIFSCLGYLSGMKDQAGRTEDILETRQALNDKGKSQLSIE